MGNNNAINWLEQRFALMRIHLQELKQLQREQQKATQAIKQYHYQQRQHLVAAEDKAMAKVRLDTIQASQLTKLSVEFSEKRSLLLTRQQREELDQQVRIDQERGV
jgi:chromosome condensin MukBEF ATPase and DNA-binding subunit MukB